MASRTKDCAVRTAGWMALGGALAVVKSLRSSKEQTERR
jgi:hypothetical protein